MELSKDVCTIAWQKLVVVVDDEYLASQQRFRIEDSARKDDDGILHVPRLVVGVLVVGQPGVRDHVDARIHAVQIVGQAADSVFWNRRVAARQVADLLFLASDKSGRHDATG